MRLVVPVRCAGCELWDVALCEPCAVQLSYQGLLSCAFQAPRLDPVLQDPHFASYALWENSGVVKDAITRWKDHGRLDLTGYLATQLRQGAGVLGAGIGLDRRELAVVPVPSTAQANRKRYGQLTTSLAQELVRGLRQAGYAAKVQELLALNRSGEDQTGLGARARQANLQHRVKMRGEVRGQTPVLLVDDVQTTGASLAACYRVLHTAGAQVLGAQVLAFTPDPKQGTIGLTKTP